jgi:hypothetical protein
VGRKFSVSPHAAGRHLINHVTAERRAHLVAGPLRLHELAERASEADLTLQQYLGMLRSTLFEAYLQVAEAGDRQAQQGISGRLVEVLRLEGQVNGEISRATSTINNNVMVMSSPAMADFEAMLVECLRPFPDAMRAVITGIEQMRGGGIPRSGEPAALEHQA